MEGNEAWLSHFPNDSLSTHLSVLNLFSLGTFLKPFGNIIGTLRTISCIHSRAFKGLSNT